MRANSSLEPTSCEEPRKVALPLPGVVQESLELVAIDLLP
jgi:hypothetical protein